MQLVGLKSLLVAWFVTLGFVVAPAAVLAAPANLLISVKFGKDLRAERRSAEASTSRLYQTGDRRDSQQVRVLEGHKATISYSQSVPYPVISAGFDGYRAGRVYGLEYRDMESGFVVSPRLEKGRVVLEIEAQDERMSPRGGSVIEGSSVQTTVSGELGQWIQLSGYVELADGAGADGEGVSIVRSTDNSSRQVDNEIWVRVDRLD